MDKTYERLQNFEEFSERNEFLLYNPKIDKFIIKNKNSQREVPKFLLY